jgi:hypothetical protein
MTTTAEELERALRADLDRLGDRVVDEDFAGELYRALANRAWRRAADGGDAHVVVSWKRAEELVNDLRAKHGAEPLELAQTGGEGELSDDVERELGRLRWTSRPLHTGRHDDQHLASPADEPRTPPGDRFADAHADAEAERRRKIT